MKLGGRGLEFLAGLLFYRFCLGPFQPLTYICTVRERFMVEMSVYCTSVTNSNWYNDINMSHDYEVMDMRGKALLIHSI